MGAMDKPTTITASLRDEAMAPGSLAELGALIGDPVRAAILQHLSDGTRRPAGELALLAGASPQAASAHLAQLVDGGLLAVEKQGRHRFYGLAYSHDMRPLKLFEADGPEVTEHEGRVDLPKLTQRFFEQTMSFAEENRDRPFFVLLALTVSLGMAKQGLVRRLRQALPYVNRVSGAIIIVAGLYLAHYGWYERGLRASGEGDSTAVDTVTGWSADISSWVNDVGSVRLGLLLSLALAAILTATFGLKAKR